MSLSTTRIYLKRPLFFNPSFPPSSRARSRPSALFFLAVFRGRRTRKRQGAVLGRTYSLRHARRSHSSFPAARAGRSAGVAIKVPNTPRVSRFAWFLDSAKKPRGACSKSPSTRTGSCLEVGFGVFVVFVQRAPFRVAQLFTVPKLYSMNTTGSSTLYEYYPGISPSHAMLTVLHGSRTPNPGISHIITRHVDCITLQPHSNPGISQIITRRHVDCSIPILSSLLTFSHRIERYNDGDTCDRRVECVQLYKHVSSRHSLTRTEAHRRAHFGSNTVRTRKRER